MRIKAANCSIGLTKTPASFAVLGPSMTPFSFIDARSLQTGCLKQHCDRPPLAAEFDKLSDRGYGAQFSIAQQINHYQRAIFFCNHLKSPPGVF